MINNKMYGKLNSTKCVNFSIKHLDTKKNKHNYILSKPENHEKILLSFGKNLLNTKNIYFYIKNNGNFCNKNNLCVLLKKYNAHNICPRAYDFPGDYENYATNCINKKMILKSNTQRQEGLFVTSHVQSKKFIDNEKIIVAQEYLQDCLMYKNHRLSFRLWFIVSCHKLSTNGYVGRDGLVYYNNNTEPDISSFYGSRDLYDNGFPMTIHELDNKTNNKIMTILIEKIKDLFEIIKKDQQKYYINDDGHYHEMFGVDLH
jgi:hypothetical protein